MSKTRVRTQSSTSMSGGVPLPPTEAGEETTGLGSPSPDSTQAQLTALTQRVEQLERVAHTDHTLSGEVIEQIATNAVAKMVTHFSTLLKMGDTLLSK